MTEVTNEQIALALGWTRGRLFWHTPDWPNGSQEVHPEPPDYLHDYSTLAEAERVCREHDWGVAAWMLGSGKWQVTVIGDTADTTRQAYGPTLLVAWWACILAALSQEGEAG